jgi:amino acid permease
MNGIIVFCLTGVLTLYAILFSTISAALFADPAKPDSILASKIFYCVILGLIQLPHVFRKSIAEMKLSTYLLFTGIISLLILMQVKLRLQGSYSQRAGPEHVSAKNITFESYVDTVNICVTSFGFVLTLFPVYSSMRKDVRP